MENLKFLNTQSVAQFKANVQTMKSKSCVTNRQANASSPMAVGQVR